MHSMDQNGMVVATFEGEIIELKMLKTFNVPSSYIKCNNDLGWIFEVYESDSANRYIFWTDRDIVEVVSAMKPIIREIKAC